MARKLIFIVEDNAADVMLICEAIQEHGIDADLQVAKDGESAIRKLNQLSNTGTIPDLVILDLDLPGENGLAVLKRLRASCMRSIQVVMFTGSESLLDRDEAVALGVSAYVNKPVQLEELTKIGELVKGFIG